MVDHRFSTHIACSDWQPMWRHSSTDVIDFLHLIWSNWLIILVLCLVATPSAATPSYGQGAANDNQIYTYQVKPRYLDQRQCVSLSRDELPLNCSCTPGKPPPDIKEKFKKLRELPWERETTPSTTTSASTTGSTTSATESSTTLQSTPPRGIDNPVPKTPANRGESTGPDSVSLSFAIIIPIVLLTAFILGAVYVLYRTQRGRRGRYRIQGVFTRVMSSSRGNQSPSSNANGSANNQQSDIEINAVQASPHYKNGGTPAKCGNESEVTSDQEEGNVNSSMLKRKSEIDEDRRRSSCKTPEENRRPSRQIRLDSQSPLVANMDLMSDEEEDGEENFGSNGHLADELMDDSMQDDSTFDSVCLEDNNVQEET
ncbi:uncharacterized protein [Amphiura filiformis]|uniref:uncharacterized protein isoform X2 n=1 Tax=Amphiura filiformis TaxID=82378 RepID=UPI003B21232C